MDSIKYNMINDSLNKFQRDSGIKFVIAGYVGSKSIGLGNANSDDDVYLIYDSEISDKMHFSDNTLDCMGFSKEKVLQALKLYSSGKHFYPSWLHYNSATDNDIINPYYRRLVYMTMLAEDRWIFSPYNIEILKNMFADGLNIIDILDYYSAKAYEIYKEIIFNSNVVAVRDYLTVVQQLLYCIQLVETKQRPPMMIDELLSISKQYLSADFVKEVEVLKCKNLNTIDKNLNLVNRNNIIEDWVFRVFCKLSGILEHGNMGSRIGLISL